MDYRMKREYLKNNFWSDNAEDEKYLTEYLTRGIFHKWNDKLEILTRICDYYSYMFRFYPDGRLVSSMTNAGRSAYLPKAFMMSPIKSFGYFFI